MPCPVLNASLAPDIFSFNVLPTCSHPFHPCWIQDTLIVAGDISDDLPTLERTLESLTAIFGTVFFVPGNHDLWCEIRGERLSSSFDKLEKVLAICSRLGVRTTPAVTNSFVLFLQCWSQYPFTTPWANLVYF